MSDPRLGSVVDGRHRIIEPLARGGMGAERPPFKASALFAALVLRLAVR